MKFNPEKHHRRSIRIPDYDYATVKKHRAGLGYFVTICTNNHELLFGYVVDGEMVLNIFGEIVNSEWIKTAQLRHNINLDEFAVMPNHVHGIIKIMNESVGAYCDTPLQPQFKSPSRTIGAIIRGFKSTVTKQINEIRKIPGNKLWQRNYYEYIIRDENDLNRIRKYIIKNPLK